MRNDFGGLLAQPIVVEAVTAEAVTERVALGAAFTARISRFGNQQRLEVTNIGDGPAENVELEVEVEEGVGKPTIFLPEKPIRHLPAGAIVDFPMALGFGDTLQWDLVFKWTDARGEHEARQSMFF